VSKQRPDGTFFHIPRRPLPPYQLIVCDEISMLPKDMWELLLSHHIHILALGDPAQLPPISEDNGILAHPHIFLDEIVRQAQDNEIIRLSMDIRLGRPLSLFHGKQVQVITKSELVDGMYTWADQIICARNDTRRQINDYMRQKLFGITSPEPLEGDKVICLRNNWDDINELGDCMVNGTIGTVSYIRYDYNDTYLSPKLTWDFLPDGYIASQCPQDPYFRDVSIDYKLLTTGEPTVNQQNFKRFPKEVVPQEFDYGYCITCWKAQGSQYNKVLLFEENFPFEEEEHRKYLYTGITRAVEKLVVVKK
jgi:exodeoxyribonuclease-5